jgi:hypothetical protein
LFSEINREPHFAAIDLPRSAKIDHLPGLLRQLVNRLESSLNSNDEQDMESAWAHGTMRRQQGYSVPMLVEEARILYRVIANTLHANLLDMDISSIILDLERISDSLSVMLAQSLRSFLTEDRLAA